MSCCCSHIFLVMKAQWVPPIYHTDTSMGLNGSLEGRKRKDYGTIGLQWTSTHSKEGLWDYGTTMDEHTLEEGRKDYGTMGLQWTSTHWKEGTMGLWDYIGRVHTGRKNQLWEWDLPRRLNQSHALLSLLYPQGVRTSSTWLYYLGRKLPTKLLSLLFLFFLLLFSSSSLYYDSSSYIIFFYYFNRSFFYFRSSVSSSIYVMMDFIIY